MLRNFEQIVREVDVTNLSAYWLHEILNVCKRRDLITNISKLIATVKFFDIESNGRVYYPDTRFRIICGAI